MSVSEAIMFEVAQKIKNFSTRFYLIKNNISDIDITSVRKLLVLIGQQTWGDENDSKCIETLELLSKKPDSTYVCDYLDLFNLEENRILSIKFLNKNSINVDFVNKTLDIFESHSGKYKFLKKIIRLDHNIIPEIICSLANRWDNKFNVCIAKLLLSKSNLDTHFFDNYIALFPQQDQLVIAISYLNRSTKTISDMLDWLPSLKSVDDANYLLHKYDFENIDVLLYIAGFDVTKKTNRIIEPRLENEFEFENEIDNRDECMEIQKVMKFDVNELFFDSLCLDYIHLPIDGSYVEYDTELDQILNFKNDVGGNIMLGDINMRDHILENVRQKFDFIRKN